MASEKLVVAVVQDILHSADLHLVSPKMVREQAAEKLGFDVEPFRELIRVRSRHACLLEGGH